MTKKPAISLLIVFVSVLGFISFVKFGGTSTPSPVKDLSILDVKDERLTLGSSDAPLAIVEYADVLCPYCAKVNEEVIPRIKTDYIDTKKAQYEIRLVAMISPDSQRAAEGAYCAAEQDKFWDYMDTAYSETWRNYYSQNLGHEDVKIFSDTRIAQFADKVGLDSWSWQGCVDSGKYADVLEKNKAEMTKMEAYGTPHFLFNEQSYSGAPPYVFFQKALDAEYAKKVAE